MQISDNPQQVLYHGNIEHTHTHTRPNVAKFCHTALCSPYVNRRFGGKYHLHLHGRKSAKTLAARWFLARIIFDFADGDTFFRNVRSHTDYLALYPKREPQITHTPNRKCPCSVKYVENESISWGYRRRMARSRPSFRSITDHSNCVTCPAGSKTIDLL
jgi:hypothetical protein